MRRVLKVVAAVVLIGGAVVGALAMRDELRRRRIEARYRPLVNAATARDVVRARAIREALKGAVVPRADLGACPASMTRGALTTIIYDPTHDYGGANWGAYLEVLSPMAEKDEVDPRAWEAAVARIDEWDREIDVVAETKDWARRSDDATGTYVGGELAGHAYLYSFRESKILCAGIFRATNMGEIEVSVKRRRDGVVLEDTFRRSADSQLTSFAQTEALTNLQLAGAPP